VALPRRTGRSRLTLALLVLTSLAVLTLDFRNAGIVESARRAAATVFSPLRGVADTATSPFSNGWNGITRYGDVKSENDRLRTRIADLEGRQAQATAALTENEQLHKEANIPWVGDVPKVEARVVSGSVSNFSHSVDISKGSKDGIAVGMPVVSGDGLVGRVQQVTAGRSTIQLITDPDFRVGVRVLPTSVLGTARGTGKGDPLVVDTGLGADDTSIKPGASVTTSGEETSVFPASIPIGTVTGSSKASGGLTLNLSVKPLVDTERLSFITVLLRADPG
jgi:rod shape-determining protein MreC